MKESERTKTIKNIFKDETECYTYETYEGIDGLKRIKTYIILNDGFLTKILLSDLGLYTEGLASFLKEKGYINMDTLKLTKK